MLDIRSRDWVLLDFVLDLLARVADLSNDQGAMSLWGSGYLLESLESRTRELCLSRNNWVAHGL